MEAKPAVETKQKVVNTKDVNEVVLEGFDGGGDGGLDITGEWNLIF